jgi:hypothetical protein
MLIKYRQMTISSHKLLAYALLAWQQPDYDLLNLFREYSCLLSP